jgi:hypothetical protein
MSKMRMCRVAVVLTAIFAVPGVAWADLFVQPFAAVNTGGQTTRESAGLGVSGGWMGSWFGGEGEAAWSPWFFDRDGGFRTKYRAATYTGTALGGPRIGAWQPYGAFGLGVLRSEIEEVGGLATLTDTRAAWHAGGGVMWTAGPIGLRADARYIRAIDDTEPRDNVFAERLGHFDYWRIGGGVAFRW